MVLNGAFSADWTHVASHPPTLLKHIVSAILPRAILCCRRLFKERSCVIHIVSRLQIGQA